jgi:hypothetical protein
MYMGQTEIDRAEPLVPASNALEFQMTIENLKYINYNLLNKLQKNWLRQTVGQSAL